MKEHKRFHRAVSMLLAIVLLAVWALPVGAVSAGDTAKSLNYVERTQGRQLGTLPGSGEPIEETPAYAADEQVRVSIVLEKAPTIAAGYATQSIAENAGALRYRHGLEAQQAKVETAIEQQALDGQPLDVVWNLTLAANLISANVEYGQIERIAAIDGVKEVLIETRYEPQRTQDGTADPQMATSSGMIGSTTAWADGYTGAGSRIAVIDTGIDTAHQSFDAAAFDYSLEKLAEEAGVSVQEYRTSLKLLDAEKIASVYDQLNLAKDENAPTAQELFRTDKIAFGYNYIDNSLTIDHADDTQGEHGSHVAGIAAANAYVARDGAFVPALDSVLVQGVAPDAQLLIMKVFGKNGGAYDSDYMAAIEDAIVLGADSINLSLGSGNPGFARSLTYQNVMDSLTESGVVVTMSAGNSYAWAENAKSGAYLYGDDVSFATTGSPSSFTNSLSVASVDNDGFTGEYLKVGDELLFYTQTGEKNLPFNTLAGEQQYVMIDGVGTEEEFAALADVLAGKIAVCSRGDISFYLKAENAVKYGAIGTIIYNNRPGTVSMDLSDYTKTQPVVAITQADAELLRAAAQKTAAEGSNAPYYLGTLTVGSDIASVHYDSAYYTMSDFSSWGVPGSLTLKPEITAPGGNIYSVNGTHKDNANGPVLGGTDQYEGMSGTSMAAPQTAGMAALAAQYIREKGLCEKTGLSARILTQSLLMSTAQPLLEEESGSYWSVLKQGAGLANVGSVVTAQSYIKMGDDATDSAADGKVKVELGDDPAREGVYRYSFTVNNLSDSEKSYTLSGSFFTQDQFTVSETDAAPVTWLDTATTPLAVETVYTVEGETFVPQSKVEADVDRDGDTDADDAQALLDYIVGNNDGSALDIAAGDVDGDGKATSYDAHLILAHLETARFTVPANGSVSVQVQVALTQAQKDALDASYPNGAYVEGYTFVEPVTTEEGEVPDVTHSIPVLGFYGNWSDPSMYDRATYAGVLHGDTTVPYTGVTQTNTLLIQYEGDDAVYFQIGNPYITDDSDAMQRAAINSSDSLYQLAFSPIRNAAAAAAVATDQNNNILYMSAVTEQWVSAYYHVNGASWLRTTSSLMINKKVSSLGVTEGDTLTVSMVAVPEYYEKAKNTGGITSNGTITEQQLAELITSGTLGKGAYLSTAMTVDNTRPVVTDITKDEETGNLVVTASDNNYIAAVQVYDAKGNKLLGQALPQQTEAGQTSVTTVDLQQAIANKQIHEKCLVMVGDYANNTVTYEVEYGGEPEDFTGRFFAFTSGEWAGGSDGNRLMELDPEKVYALTYLKTDGAYTFAPHMNIRVNAAEYVNGYVLMAATDGYLYVAKHDGFDNCVKIGKYRGTGGTSATVNISDMAYSYKENKLYALVMDSSTSTVYSVNTATAELTKEFTVNVHSPKNNAATYQRILTLAIDDDGNFYAANYGGQAYTFLYKWSLDDVVNGAVKALEPVSTTTSLKPAQSFFSGSFAWDHENDQLYYLNVQSSAQKGGSAQNYLLRIDTATGAAAVTNTAYLPDKGVKTGMGKVGNAYTGFYIPTSIRTEMPGAETAVSITLDKEKASVMAGSVIRLYATTEPWNLSDATVNWTSGNEAVATVKNGVVTGVAPGVTTITATTAAEPHLTASCEVTVRASGSVTMQGLITAADGSASWAAFTTDAPEAWTVQGAAAAEYYAGALHNDKLYVHNAAGTVYAVDPSGFEAAAVLNNLPAEQLWSDAASAPAWLGKFGDLIAICNNGLSLEVFNFEQEDGDQNQFDMPGYFREDRMAAIAYVGSGYYNGTNPTHYYYVLTESGDMWSFGYTYMQSTGNYRMLVGKLGSTGIKLTGVSGMTGDYRASMLFDFDSRFLYVVSSSTQAGCATLYAIDPDSLTAANLGSFGMGVNPVVALYQNAAVTTDAAPSLVACLNAAEAVEPTAQTTQQPAVPEEPTTEEPLEPEQPAEVPEEEIPEAPEESTPEAPVPETPVDELPTQETPAEEKPEEPIGGEDPAAGTLNSVVLLTTPDGQPVKDVVTVDTKARTVTVRVPVEASTNGKYDICYDADILTLNSVQGTQYYSWRDENATVHFAWAEEAALSRDAAVLTFTYEAAETDRTTDVLHTTLEDGDTLTAEGETALAVQLPGEPKQPVTPSEPTTPSQPTTPTDSGSTGSTAAATPDTGDVFPLTFYLVLGMLSAAMAAAAMYLSGRRRRS